MRVAAARVLRVGDGRVATMKHGNDAPRNGVNGWELVWFERGERSAWLRYERSVRGVVVETVEVTRRVGP